MARLVRRRTAIGLLALCVAGCAGSSVRVTPTKARNPVTVGDSALAVTAPDDGTLRGMSPKDCSVWPIDDEYQVRRKGETVCATAVLSRPILASDERGGADGAFDPALPLVWASDTSTAAQPVTLERTGEARKFGECLDGDGRLYGVWRQMYERCAADPGLLTGKTRRLELKRPTLFGSGRDLVVWQFE